MADSQANSFLPPGGTMGPGMTEMGMPGMGMPGMGMHHPECVVGDEDLKHFRTALAHILEEINMLQTFIEQSMDPMARKVLCHVMNLEKEKVCMLLRLIIHHDPTQHRICMQLCREMMGMGGMGGGMGMGDPMTFTEQAKPQPVLKDYSQQPQPQPPAPPPATK